MAKVKVNQGWKAVGWALSVFLYDLKTLLVLGQTEILYIGVIVVIENFILRIEKSFLREITQHLFASSPSAST